jgi:hypothetical protein
MILGRGLAGISHPISTPHAKYGISYVLLELRTTANVEAKGSKRERRISPSGSREAAARTYL